MNKKSISRDSILTLAVFFLLVVLFYLIGYWMIFRMGRANPLMLSVGVATVFTCLIRRRKLSALGWQWGEWKYQWLSYLIPLATIAVAHLIIWTSDLGGWYDSGFVATQKASYNLSDWSDASLIAFHFLTTATIGFVMLLPSVLGEEIAWRGFLVPELAKFMSFSGVCLTSGIIWSMFHWPLMFKGIYGHADVPLYFQLTCFTLGVVSNSVIMTYMRLKTGSVWTAVIFHMSWNIFLQKVFTPLTLANAESGWYLDEFGIVLPAITFIVAIYYWNKGNKEFA